MLTFVKKDFVWGCMDQGLHRHLGWQTHQIHLKTWQDIAVYSYIRNSRGHKIAEIGGGNSRILHKLSENNECYNIDKFAGEHGEPTSEVRISNVKNIISFVGEFNPEIKPNNFDILYSVSVIEHVPNASAEKFMLDMLRILKPGGLALHAIDLYVSDTPQPSAERRLQIYRAWLDPPALHH